MASEINEDREALERALRTARVLRDLGHSLDSILDNPIIPAATRESVRLLIESDENIVLTPARTIVADPSKPNWLNGLDRSSWYYWPTLRQFLLAKKGRSESVVRSLDDSSDRVLRRLAPPSETSFDIRGLVLGYVQSGKTANFSALIAKAADAGYRLIVVLSGVDNGLRRQTNARLKKELVGYSPPRGDAVGLPPTGKQWHEFTRDEVEGDFSPGFANHAALQGSQPVLLVVKKNGDVLRRLITWLEAAPGDIRRDLPVLLIDDEADQASIDTKGSSGGDDTHQEYESPSAINALIRTVLQLFERKCYVAYTATPFANVLIPYNVEDPTLGNDLYPRDFIIDLPKPAGYFGAEEYFGRLDQASGEMRGGLNVVRHVAAGDLEALEDGELPPQLQDAVVDFVLAGAARAARGDASSPVAMLVHTSMLVANQQRLTVQIAAYFSQLRDEWRYQRSGGVRNRFHERWDTDHTATTRRIDAALVQPFEEVELFIGPFLEAAQVLEVNSVSGEVLDYDREPGLKAIVVGGNRLSRGLTIEGLVVSYFVRRSVTYDTLMQMGRWFGYRAGYQDLTRIFTTAELAQWFSDLAFVEYRLREDIGIYEDLGLTPAEVGARIWKHPAMQVTSVLKQRYAGIATVRQSYDLTLEQTFKFPFRNPVRLRETADANLGVVRAFLTWLQKPDFIEKGPVWTRVSAEAVVGFLRQLVQDPSARTVDFEHVCSYINECRADNELLSWTVAVRSRESLQPTLGTADWGGFADSLNQIGRSRLEGTESLGVITGQGDEAVGLSSVQLEQAKAAVAKAHAEGRKKAFNAACREVRHPSEGLLLLYPISRFSGHEKAAAATREALYADPLHPDARDLIGLALSFPRSNTKRVSEEYVTGSVPWRAVHE